MTQAVPVCVLNVETRLSTGARALLTSGDRATVARSSLLEITAASVLAFGIGDRVDGFSLTTALSDEVGEAGVLAVVDAALSRAYSNGGLLVTHNGVSHGVPTCARRALHHWMFDASGVTNWWRGGDGRHIDTMLAFGGSGGRGPSLIDLGLGLGFQASVPTRNALSTIPQVREKVEVDVAATAVCYLFLAAAEGRSAAWLADAWTGLSRYLLSPGVRAAHLMPLARIGIGIADERRR